MHKFQLNAASSSLMGRSWALEEQTLLGSSDSCQVQVNADGISARHALIVLDQGWLNIEDLDSETGTWINGERVTNTSLASGDEIRIGPHRFLLQAPGLRPERVITPEVSKTDSKAWIAWLAAGLTVLAVVAAWYFQLLPFVG